MPFDAEPSVEVTTRDRLIRLRDFLAELPARKFDMSSASRGGCGTPACIAGWGAHLFGIADTSPMFDRVGAALGLTSDQQSALFQDNIPTIDIAPATPAQAVVVLDHLLKTGEVDWSVAFK